MNSCTGTGMITMVENLSNAEMKKNILIIEDDEGISSFIKLELIHEGYNATIAADGRSGLETFEKGGFDLILLDIMLPQLNGIEVLRRIRKTSDIPVVMVTAKSDTADTVTALDTGADDYIIKPFAIEELLARIRRMFRRTPPEQNISPQQKIHIRDIEIDTDACRVLKNGREIQLTRTEYMLLLCLATNKNKAMSRDQIIDFVWGTDHFIEANSVDVYVRYLRTKLDGTQQEEPVIKTLRGIGYIISTE